MYLTNKINSSISVISLLSIFPICDIIFLYSLLIFISGILLNSDNFLIFSAISIEKGILLYNLKSSSSYIDIPYYIKIYTII